MSTLGGFGEIRGHTREVEASVATVTKQEITVLIHRGGDCSVILVWTITMDGGGGAMTNAVSVAVDGVMAEGAALAVHAVPAKPPDALQNRRSHLQAIWVPLKEMK